MNLLSSEFGSQMIATSDILSNRRINEAYSTLGEQALLFSSLWSLYTLFFVSLLVCTSHFASSCYVGWRVESEEK